MEGDPANGELILRDRSNTGVCIEVLCGIAKGSGGRESVGDGNEGACAALVMVIFGTGIRIGCSCSTNSIN